MNEQPNVITEEERARIEHAKKLGWRDIIYISETGKWAGRIPVKDGMDLRFRLEIPYLQPY